MNASDMGTTTTGRKKGKAEGTTQGPTMPHRLRPSTLEALGLGTPGGFLAAGARPVDAATLVDRVFGPPDRRGAMVISGANGIVGAGKAMQFAARLAPYGVPIIALDLAGSPDGLGAQYAALERSFGTRGAAAIMQRIVRMSYDGTSLPPDLKAYRPCFLLEAVPEKLELKRAHYALFREAFPGIVIRSVTSGFPAAQLGVGIAHPAFPHEVNKVFEVVEDGPSDLTRLLWALGLIPMAVSDHWSFVLDVFFCGLMNAATRYHERSNMPCWKVDKLVRRLLGANPFRAHDSIGARGANFLTWSCLHHLAEQYGPLFAPAATLTAHKDSGMGWYPPDHFRPLVNWRPTDAELEEFRTMILGPLFQMTSIMLHEQRADLAVMNALCELCAQFNIGLPALIRRTRRDEVMRTVAAYHTLHPEAAGTTWYPEVFDALATPAWQHLYVNAEHDGTAGVITLGRERYNADVDAELNRAIDWLVKEGIRRVTIMGDMHLSTQMVGADTNDFHPALDDEAAGLRLATDWSRTARRLHEAFEVSVGLVDGKRCMGGMLELMMHSHYLLAVDGAVLAMPEVTLPVVPGMEGCHWALRRAAPADRPRLVDMLLSGASVKAKDAVGWLVDHSGDLDSCLRTAWRIMRDGPSALAMRPLEKGAFTVDGLNGEARTDEAHQAIAACIRAACGTSLDEALAVQAGHSAAFLAGRACRRGRVGTERDRVMRD